MFTLTLIHDGNIRAQGGGGSRTFPSRPPCLFFYIFFLFTSESKRFVC